MIVVFLLGSAYLGYARTRAFLKGDSAAARWIRSLGSKPEAAGPPAPAGLSPPAAISRGTPPTDFTGSKSLGMIPVRKNTQAAAPPADPAPSDQPAAQPEQARLDSPPPEDVDLGTLDPRLPSRVTGPDAGPPARPAKPRRLERVTFTGPTAVNEDQSTQAQAGGPTQAETPAAADPPLELPSAPLEAPPAAPAPAARKARQGWKPPEVSLTGESSRGPQVAPGTSGTVRGAGGSLIQGRSGSPGGDAVRATVTEGLQSSYHPEAADGTGVCANPGWWLNHANMMCYHTRDACATSALGPCVQR